MNSIPEFPRIRSNRNNIFSVDSDTYLGSSVTSVRIIQRFSNWIILSLFVLSCYYLAVTSYVLLLLWIGGDELVDIDVVSRAFLMPTIVILFLFLRKRQNNVLVVEMQSKRIAVYESCDAEAVKLIKDQFLAGLTTGIYPKLMKPFIERRGFIQFYN